MPLGLNVSLVVDEINKVQLKENALRIRRMRIALTRGTSKVQEMVVTSELVDISAWRSLSKPGDVIVIELLEAGLRTPSGYFIIEKIPEKIIMIHLK